MAIDLLKVPEVLWHLGKPMLSTDFAIAKRG